MKKTVIILIGIIYAASIFLVTFYGSKTETNTLDIVPATEIEIVGDGIGTLEDGSKFVSLSKPLTPDESLNYQINFSETIKICRDYLRNQTNDNALNVEGLIVDNIEPIRPDRTFRRQARFKLPMSFCYR